MQNWSICFFVKNNTVWRYTTNCKVVQAINSVFDWITKLHLTIINDTVSCSPMKYKQKIPILNAAVVEPIATFRKFARDTPDSTNQ
jgi:cAMP phosphodiesterase